MAIQILERCTSEADGIFQCDRESRDRLFYPRMHLNWKPFLHQFVTQFYWFPEQIEFLRDFLSWQRFNFGHPMRMWNSHCEPESLRQFRVYVIGLLAWYITIWFEWVNAFFTVNNKSFPICDRCPKTTLICRIFASIVYGANLKI